MMSRFGKRGGFRGYLKRQPECNLSTLLAIFIVSLGLSSCTAPRNYVGMPALASEVSSEISKIAQRAQSGDKQAMFELARAFEEGRGVPLDLVKARDLYFAAATEKSADKLIVLPGPKGRGGAPVIIRQSSITASDRTEAILGWGRVVEKLEDKSMRAAQAEVRSAVTNLDVGEEEVDREALSNLFGFGSLFWALQTGVGQSLENAMLEGAGAVLLTSNAVEQSVIYAAKRSGVSEADQFCRSILSADDFMNESSLRVAALCEAKMCHVNAASRWEDITATITGAGSGRNFDRDTMIAFGSASFAMRVASYCGRRGEEEVIGNQVWQYLARYEAELHECDERKCSQEQAEVFELGRSAIANILLWSIENGQPTAPRIDSAIAIWSRGSVLDPFLGPSRDPQVEALCAGIALEYQECRRSYPYGYFLENRLFELLGLLIRTDSMQDRNEHIARFLSIYSIDVAARDAREVVVGLSNIERRIGDK